MLRLFGVPLKIDTVIGFAFIEISIFAIIFLALIIARYVFHALPHELFIELMVIVGVGMSFDHYAVSALNLKK